MACFNPRSAVITGSEVRLKILTRALGEALVARGLTLVTAESCTGGWIAKIITDLPGSSAWLEAGFVVYSNLAKQNLLGVSAETLMVHGAVSEAAVREMARGALRRSAARVALAVSGIAGPGGGSPDKPVGTVWLAWALPGNDIRTQRVLIVGNRNAVRRHSVVLAMRGLLDHLTLT